MVRPLRAGLGRALRPARLAGLALALCFILLPLAAAAQTAGTGTIRGRVTGAAGAGIDGATVTVVNEATGLSRSAPTDADGSYAIADLPLTGTWKLSTTASGMTPQEQGGIQLRAGHTATIDVALGADSLAETLTVYGTAEGVQANTPQLSIRLDNEKVQETPLLGRKLTSLPLLNSSVRSARGTGDLFLGNTLFVINGGGRRQATFTVDGGTADDAWGRQTIFTNVPLAAVEEFTVLTNAFSAEYGRSAGGAVNLVTRTGTNDFHADLLALVRPGSLQSNAPVTGQKAEDELLQGSAFVAGPMAHDRAYFSVAGEASNQDRDSVVSSPLAPGVFTGEYRQRLLFARADAELAPGHHLFGRYDLDRLRDSNPQDVVGGNNLPSAGRTFRRKTQSATLGETAVLGSTAVNDARLVYQDGDPITEFEPLQPSVQLIRTGVSTEGESRFAHLTNRQLQLADTVTLALGSHLLKVGGDYQRSRSGGDGQEFGSPFVLGQFTFRPGISPAIPTSQLTLADVTRFTQGFGNVHYTLRETLWSVFAQDDYRLRDDLVLNLGVRYDKQSLTGDDDNVSPRVGFSWNPGADPKMAVRGGYGIYYSEIQANIDAGWELAGPTGFFTFSVAPGQLGFPTAIAPLPQFPPGAVLPARDVTVRPGRAGFYSQFFDVSRLNGYPSELENPRTEMATLGAERELFTGWYLSLDGVHTETMDIPRNVDLNAPTTFVRTVPGQTRSAAAADATRPIAPVANGYRRILVTTNLGEAKYDAALLNLRKSWSGSGSMLLSYTYSHSRNTVEADAPGGDANDARNLDAEWADSLLDQRHRAVLSGWVGIPWALRLGGVAEYATGRPFNITTGVDNNGDGANTDRPVIGGRVIGRNEGRGDDLYQATLFLERDFSLGFAILGLRAEVYNVTDHENVVGYNGVYGNDASGQPLATFGQKLGGLANVDPGRQWQFQARLRW